jgi:hypothetical protein
VRPHRVSASVGRAQSPLITELRQSRSRWEQPS